VAGQHVTIGMMGNQALAEEGIGGRERRCEYACKCKYRCSCASTQDRTGDHLPSSLASPIPQTEAHYTGAGERTKTRTASGLEPINFIV
jgi:hypothetical protein